MAFPLSCRIVAAAALVTCQALAGFGVVHAESYPSGPLHMVVPFPPGGGTDTLARVMAKGLGEGLNESVIVENKPGAGTIIGSDYVARSQPDGLTMLFTTSAHSINESLVPKLPYSAKKSFSSIALVGTAPMVLVVRPDSKFKTIKDIAEYAKSHPGELTYGSSGTGTAVHLAAELFKSIADVNITHVPYRGASPAMTDLMGGHTDMFFGTSGAVAPFVKSGKLRAIAITTADPSPFWPNVPTIAASGYPSYEAEVWYAVFAAANTPEPIVTKLNDAISKATQSDDIAQAMNNEGVTPKHKSPAELQHYVEQEIERWGKVISDGNIQAQ